MLPPPATDTAGEARLPLSVHAGARDPSLEELAQPYRAGGETEGIQGRQALMAWVYESFTYRKDVTTVATTVTEVLAGRTGSARTSPTS